MPTGTTPPARRQPLTLNPRHLELLAATGRYNILTVKDYQRRLRLRSRPHVRWLLSELCGGRDGADRPYLVRAPLPARVGGVEHFYALSSRGVALVAREWGVPVSGRTCRRAELAQLSYGTILHDLSVNRFLIALRTFCDGRQDLRLADEQIRTQYELAREPLIAQASRDSSAQDATVRVVPDAWVNVEVVKEGAARECVPLWIELDRGTAYAPALRARLHSLLRFLRPGGPYEKIFGTDAVTVLYLSTAGERRRDSLARVTAEVLAAEKREDWAEFFLFGAASFGRMYEEANTLFTEKVWQRPYGDDPVGLFG